MYTSIYLKMMDLNLSVDNIDDEHNMSTANSNNLEVSNTILGKQSAKKSIHKRFRSKSMDFRVDEKKALPNMWSQSYFQAWCKAFQTWSWSNFRTEASLFQAAKEDFEHEKESLYHIEKVNQIIWRTRILKICKPIDTPY